MKKKQCNYCQESMSTDRPHYCEACEAVMFRECKACHKPYHHKKYFKTSAERCNSCCKKKKKNGGEASESNCFHSTAISDIDSFERGAAESNAPEETPTQEMLPPMQPQGVESYKEDSDSEPEQPSNQVIPVPVQLMAGNEDEGNEADADTDLLEEEEEDEEPKPKKRKKSTPTPAVPKKSNKKAQFTKKEMSLLEELKHSEIGVTKQQKKKQPKDNTVGLKQNSKTLSEILGGNAKGKRGPKPGTRQPVSAKEKSQKNLLTALCALKKTDPAFNFNINLTM